MKRQTITSAERQVVSRYGRYWYWSQPGAAARVKRQMTRRERREGRTEARGAWE